MVGIYTSKTPFQKMQSRRPGFKRAGELEEALSRLKHLAAVKGQRSPTENANLRAEIEALELVRDEDQRRQRLAKEEATTRRR